MSKIHPIFEQAMAPFIKPLRAAEPVCERCDEFGMVHDQRCPEHPDHDPTPYCSHCGPKSACKCPPHPAND